MSDNSPYAAPNANLDRGSEELNQPTFFSFSGRIGRLRYLAYSIGGNLVFMVVTGTLVALIAALSDSDPAAMADPTAMTPVALILNGISLIAGTVVTVVFARRRLNDLNRSGWWFLLFLIPIANLLFLVYLVFFPGTDGLNDHGTAPAPNTIWVKILAGVLPAIFLIGLLAAIAIPAYQQYLARIQ